LVQENSVRTQIIPETTTWNKCLNMYKN
jgi:hypothetical protein